MSSAIVLPIETRLRRMLAEQLVCVIRATSSERAVNAAQALLRAGAKTIEVTMTVPGAVEAIKALASTVPADRHEMVSARRVQRNIRCHAFQVHRGALSFHAHTAVGCFATAACRRCR